MGIGDWLEDKANQIGEAVENAAESATAAVGEAIDDVLDVGADAARSVGWDGVGEALDDAGDQVSSALGGAVEERELGETEDPKELIRGEPSAITEAGNSLGKLSQAADQTGEGLRAVGNISDWHGLGADGYRVGFSPQPGNWTEAADAFTDAKTALEAWASAVSAAQGLAADAIAEWKAAVQERRRVLAWWNSLTDEQKDRATVTDTWSPRFQAARDILSRARTNRDTAADQTVASLSAAKAAAPEEPPFVSRMAANLEDAAQIGEYANLSFTDGVLSGASGLLQFVRKLNPTDTYNLTHPGEYLENMSNLAGGLVTTAADPGPMVDALIDDARANPFEALGTVAFDVATAVPTGGAGLAAKAPSLLNKVDNLAPSVRPRPEVPTRAPVDRAAPEGFSPAPIRRPRIRVPISILLRRNGIRPARTLRLVTPTPRCKTGARALLQNRIAPTPVCRPPNMISQPRRANSPPIARMTTGRSRCPPISLGVNRIRPRRAPIRHRRHRRSARTLPRRDRPASMIPARRALARTPIRRGHCAIPTRRPHIRTSPIPRARRDPTSIRPRHPAIPPRTGRAATTRPVRTRRRTNHIPIRPRIDRSSSRIRIPTWMRATGSRTPLSARHRQLRTTRTPTTADAHPQTRRPVPTA
ncbi:MULTISPECIES: putative T7SS-secreted protein [unclassified Nocardia]|uniref:putative T7SS-secreted protein n=1 Tax=unclassified Nocardia TaxID=2637762 RepID=UPI00278C094F|nr:MULTISPECIES: hypothetical protein [unclassified Nocardia]